MGGGEGNLRSVRIVWTELMVMLLVGFLGQLRNSCEVSWCQPAVHSRERCSMSRLFVEKRVGMEISPPCTRRSGRRMNTWRIRPEIIYKVYSNKYHLVLVFPNLFVCFAFLRVYHKVHYGHGYHLCLFIPQTPKPLCNQSGSRRLSVANRSRSVNVYSTWTWRQTFQVE